MRRVAHWLERARRRRASAVAVVAGLFVAGVAIAVLVPLADGQYGPAPHAGDRHTNLFTAGLSVTTSSSGSTTTSTAPVTGRHLAAGVENSTPGIKSRCHYYAYTGGPIVPDRGCTPGAVSAPAAADPRRTICRPAYLRRLGGTSAGLDARHEAALYVGYGAVGPSSSYREDHLVAVADGGSVSGAQNLWPEPISNGRAKARVEALLHRRICSGAMTVKQAALVLEGDWTREVARP